ncbi:mannitol operon transcriptional antiterminator [Gracilibacillus ureilyticus]|uniref:Mannitol operon transcriptional antiterminator n=1 Tax=Gracilibacillus ureilyticus TaxID=531814 RepID=A0A1H9PBN4_9BACI|nr:transcription antiterminator [Gracilibacillus ureilyticus]SER45315.1 mannitol operon transcriptional antiterminator [Gracilibacillus ureilyticus]
MFITSREKSIIDLVMKTSGKHTPQSLASYLNVSVRTIQRDLKGVEKLLKPFELELTRFPDDGLVINGSNEGIYKLIQQLARTEPTDETPVERKFQLLILLLNNGDVYKTQLLAKKLRVSVTTLSSYLSDITDWLAKFSISLTRKRGVGIQLNGKESDVRKAIASYIQINFHEELLEHLYQLKKEKRSDELVLGYFSPQDLLVVEEKVHQQLEQQKIRLADNDYLGLIVHITVTIQRIKNRYELAEEDEITSDRSEMSFQLISKLCGELSAKFSIPISDRDKDYLAVIFKGSKLKDSEVVDYDSILLGQIMKNIIQNVSAQLHVDLTSDFSLYQGLLAHMEPAVYRLKHQTGLFNPLTEQIKKKYPVLFMAVHNSLKEEFPDIIFQEDETAFIVLHFGSALLMNEEKPKINAVIICPTGIGTSKMLASRLQKEFHEFNSVEIKSIKEIEKANLNNFDIIISTVRLPFDDIHYIIVSPLLMEEDIDRIRSFLQANVEQLTEKHEYVKTGDREVSQKESSLQHVLQEIKDVQKSIEAILDNFQLYRKSSGNYTEVLKEMIDNLESKTLVTDAAQVIRKLEERERIGGLGIPDTNMGLFHCRDESVQELVFQIYHMDRTSLIKGMDGKDINMKNLLLMLSPEELSLKEQEILSLISTSLIEPEMTMMIHSSANEEMIRRKLEDIFSGYLQNKWVKE